MNQCVAANLEPWINPDIETEELTATISTNESITVPIGWNA